MATSENICIICAWRGTCQKKFSMCGKDMRCADFVKDVSVGEKKESGEADTDNKK